MLKPTAPYRCNIVTLVPKLSSEKRVINKATIIIAFNVLMIVFIRIFFNWFLTNCLIQKLYRF